MVTNTAAFAQDTQTGFAEATAASVVSTSTPTNTILIATAGTEGALMSSLTAMPRATVGATALYFFVSKDSGSTKLLADSELMAVHTVAATTEIPETVFSNISQSKPLRLDGGDQVYVSIGVPLTEGIVFKAEWTDF